MDRSYELLNEWVGKPVFIQILLGSNPSEDEIQRLIDDPERTWIDNAQAGARVRELVAYDSFGVVLRKLQENAPRRFVPWSAVLEIQGVDLSGEEPEE